MKQQWLRKGPPPINLLDIDRIRPKRDGRNSSCFLTRGSPFHLDKNDRWMFEAKICSRTPTGHSAIVLHFYRLVSSFISRSRIYSINGSVRRFVEKSPRTIRDSGRNAYEEESKVGYPYCLQIALVYIVYVVRCIRLSEVRAFEESKRLIVVSEPPFKSLRDAISRLLFKGACASAVSPDIFVTPSNEETSEGPIAIHDVISKDGLRTLQDEETVTSLALVLGDCRPEQSLKSRCNSDTTTGNV